MKKENEEETDIFELIIYRRSIRKYKKQQIPRETIEKIVKAGTYASNAGGGQRTMICGIHDKKLTEKIGKMNGASFDGSVLAGSCVSKEQPSMIDDRTLKNGFYGAPSVCVVFAQKNFLYSIPDAFCCAENMVLEATSLGISSCIIARAEETFDCECGRQMLREWNVPEGYIARCFVILGYCCGDYPVDKPRKSGRIKMISEEYNGFTDMY